MDCHDHLPICADDVECVYVSDARMEIPVLLEACHEYQQQDNCYREYGQAPVQFNYPPVITYPFGYAYPPSTYGSTGIIVGPQGDVWIDTGAALIGPRGQTYLDLR